MGVSSGKCDNCGADLTTEPVPSALGGFDVVCSFCEHRHHVRGEKKHVRAEPAPPPDVPDPLPVATPGPQYEPARARVRPLTIGLIFGAIFGGTVLLIFVIHLLVEGSVYWEGAPPVLATVNGREIAIGRTRDIGGSDQLYINAFDSTTLKQLWQAGPYGTYIEGYQYTHWDVAGSHVAVSDFHSKVHILDLATGAEQKVLTLTDKADRVCPVDADHVAIRQIDKVTLSLDFAAQKLIAAPLPMSCGDDPDMKALVPLDLAVGAIPNFTPRDTFISATSKAQSMNVILGVKSPGTPTPTVVGLDPKDLSIRWRVALPLADSDSSRNGGSGVAFGDRYVATYPVGQKDWHVAALDATTGTRQWDVVLKHGTGVDAIHGMECSATRVYVVRENAVDVLDAATGHSIGTIGAD